MSAHATIPPRTLLLTTEGFTDVLVLGRQNRPDPYALCTPQSAWEWRIPAAQRIGVPARMDAHGIPVQALDLPALLAQLEPWRHQIDAVAICLLFAWTNPAHEQAIATALAQHFPHWRVACSHQWSHTHTEYERTLCTVQSLGVDIADAHTASQPASGAAADDLDALAHQLDQLANHMQAVLVEQAVSSIAREAMDCACAIFAPTGQLMAQARSLPLLLGSLSPALQGLLAVYPAASMQPGDGFVLNDPWAGGTHLPDLTVVRPLFAGTTLVALLACILHHQDIGGTSAGSLPSNATHIHQEGLIIPPLQLYRADAVLPDVLRLLQANSRTPRNLAGDLAAQWQAVCAVDAPLLAVVGSTPASFAQQCQALLARSALRTRAAIARLRNGTYCFEDALDGDGVVSTPIRIAVRLTVHDDTVEIDLTDCADQSVGPANASRGAVQAAITYFARILAPDSGSDEGCLQAITVHRRPGSLVDPLYPAAVNARTNLLKILVNALLGALAQAQPGAYPAPNAGSAVVLSLGGQRRDGSRWMFTEIIASGAGGTPTAPGAAAVSTDISNARSTPAEVLEAQAPLRVETVQVRRGSGGHGQHRGGDGVLRRYRLLEGTASISYRGERHSRAPQGAMGGAPGQCAQAFITHTDGRTTDLPAKATAQLAAGETLTVATAGAGGWGQPPALAAHTT